MQLQPLMTLNLQVEPIVSAGSTPLGEVRVIPFIACSFEGPDLRGKLLPGGSDWQRVRSDGVLEIRAHYMLETEQGVVKVPNTQLTDQPVQMTPEAFHEQVAKREQAKEQARQLVEQLNAQKAQTNGGTRPPAGRVVVAPRPAPDDHAR